MLSVYACVRACEYVCVVRASVCVCACARACARAYMGGWLPRAKLYVNQASLIGAIILPLYLSPGYPSKRT